MRGSRPRMTTWLFLLDRDALLADVDVDAAPLLALVIELVAEHGDGHGQRAEDQEENSVAGHGILVLGVSLRARAGPVSAQG
jgi:hypothetical protein